MNTPPKVFKFKVGVRQSFMGEADFQGAALE